MAHRIDVHAHAFPEWHLRAAARAYPDAVELREQRAGNLVAIWSGAPIPAWDVHKRLSEMDRDGVATEILCAPLIYSKLDENTAPLCRDLNDFQATVAREHPGRFRSYLHLPVHRIEEALAELERWQSQPAVAGVVLGSNLGGSYAGDPAFLPLWQAIDRVGYPVFIHPIKPSACFGPAAPPLVMFPCDTALCAASIIYNGLFERFPAVRILLSHYGGVLPFLARRLDMGLEVAGFPPGHGQELPAPPSSYVKRFHVDTAQGYYRPAFDCAAAVYGIDHMLYGSDHFFDNSTWRPELNAFFATLGLSDVDIQTIEHGNARRVFEQAFRSET